MKYSFTVAPYALHKALKSIKNTKEPGYILDVQVTLEDSNLLVFVEEVPVPSPDQRGDSNGEK